MSESSVAGGRHTTRMSCARAVLQSIVDLGGEKLFGIPGRGVYPLLNQLAAVPELGYVTGTHEFAIAALADGYARARGEAAFLNLYMSTGVLNAASAIFLSQRDRVPLVVTATQAESWALGADHRAEISDIVEAVRPITKWAWMPPTPERVPEALRRAYLIATTPPRGPTFVALPVDYWNVEIDYVAQTQMEIATPEVVADSAAVRRLADLLLGATAPGLVVGYEAAVDDVPELLQALASRIGCLLVAEPEPARLPAATLASCFGGSFAEAAEMIENCDLILHVGVNTYEAFHGQILAAGVPKTHVWVGSGSHELGKVFAPDIALRGPMAPIVRALVAQIDAQVSPQRQAAFDARADAVDEQIGRERAELMALRDEAWDEIPMSVARVMSEIRKLMPPETILLDHSTTAVRWVRECFPVPDGRQYISASGSCQGWGIGAAVGVQFADRAAPVVGVVGDGGFMFGVQAWWTAVQYQVPLLAVVLNNGGWSSMRASLARNSPAVGEAGIELPFGWSTDYAALARSIGSDAEVITTPDELSAVLSKRLPLSAPLLLDVHCRREKKTSRSPFVGY